MNLNPVCTIRQAQINMPKAPSPLNKQRGVALLEVMIAFLLLSIGLIGFSALQVRAVRATQSSLQRTDASNLAAYMMESMRANKAAAIDPTLPYNFSKQCAYTGSPTTVAQNDLNNWFAALKKALGNFDTTCADITCTSSSSAAPGMCTINIYWDDSRALGGSSTQSVQLVGRL